MSKTVYDVNEGVTVTCPDVTSTPRGRPKAACVSASSGDRQTVLPEGSADDTPATGKRLAAYPVQRRGSRKKTLSLNPEEREALENLIEEVIMGGVGEGVIDSDASSSDEDPDAEDEQSSSSTQSSLSGSSAAVTVGDASRQDVFVKGGKKFYPGQLKVALKHMHDLPPRFVRKLAKAQQYLDAGGSMYSKPVVSVGRIDEEEETTAHAKDDSKQPKSATAAATPVTDVQERDRDKTRLKENKLKDAKKMIRTLLTDRDQYVDETASSAVVSNQSHSASGDSVFSTTASISGNQKPQSSTLYHQHDTATRQFVANNAVSVCENTTLANAASSVTVCTSETHVYHPCAGGNLSNRVAEHVSKMSDISYRTGQSSTSNSRPIPPPQFHSPSLGIPPYQLSVPVVHGMKPAPVLSQSPPGTQFWIPEPVVPSNAPGFYGSSPPVVGMTGIPSAFNQPVPYTYSIQSSYPSVQGVHASYTPQYFYSASPPNQGLVGQPYSAAAAAVFNHPVSYPLTVMPPENYVRPPTAVAANFYQNTPPPGYCPPRSHPTCDPRHMFASDVPLPTDGTRKHMFSADNFHTLSALSAPVLACRQSPVQPMNCSIDTRSGHTKPVCTVSTGAPNNRVIYPSSGYHSVDSGAKVMASVRSHTQRSSPDPANAVNSHRPRFSKSPVTVPLPGPYSVKTSPNSVLNTSIAAGSQSLGGAKSAVSQVCTLDLAVVDKTTPNPIAEHSDPGLSNVDTEPSEPQTTSPSNLNFSSPASNTALFSNSLSAESGSGDHSCPDDSENETQAEIAGSSDVSEPCSTTPATTKESETRNVANQLLDFPSTSSCTSNKSTTETVSCNDTDISGTAAVPSVSENSGGVEVVSSETKDVIQVTCSSHTGECSGESRTSIERGGLVDTGSAEDQLALRSGLNYVSEAETLNRSSSDQPQLMLSASNPVSYSTSPPTVTDEDADISLDLAAAGVVKNDPSSDLVVNLSSRLISALADMFGPPAGCDADNGISVMCHFVNCQIADTLYTVSSGKSEPWTFCNNNCKLLYRIK